MAVVRSGVTHLPVGLAAVVSEASAVSGERFDVGHVQRVFVLAAVIPTAGEVHDEGAMLDVNGALPGRMAESFPHARLVLASSVAVYGRGGRVLTEDSEPLAADVYGRSKLAGEAAVAAHGNAVVVRFGSLYGVGMRRRTFLPAVAQSAVDDGVVRVFGDGSRTQDYLHVRDAVDLLESAAESDVRGVLLGVSGTSTSNAEVARTVAELAPGCRVEHAGEDAAESFDYDPSRTREALPFRPRTELRAGLSELVEAAREGTLVAG